ncbi:mucin-5AC-like isoform X2 [Homarus americanus]|nr:mucin-5AC-like isoform X2 [Homarus americanus]
MSVICQTFVQNTWRKDLCSNCFKSKEEHGVGVRDTESKDGKLLGGGGGVSLSLRSRTGVEGLSGGGGSRRYIGVAGGVYQRGYYNNSWKSIMIDQTDTNTDTTNLKSPGLIKGMSSLVSQENEKNLLLSDMVDSEDSTDTLRSSRLLRQVKTTQSEARLLSELLESKSDREEKVESDKEEVKCREDKGDVSSDLGSEASHDGSTASSATSSACSYEVSCSAANSDTASLKSEAGSDQSAEEKGEDSVVRENNHLTLERKEFVPPVSIVKTPGQFRSKRGSISFNPQLEEVIGYGGDVDYSDGEDDFDDDDDEDYDDLTELTPDERVLRQLTDKNTDFNSDNDNLKKDIEELLPSVKELEEKRKMIIAEIEELERLGRENRMKNERDKQEEKKEDKHEEKKEDKQEGKVKLKRSSPLVSTKPLIARNNNELRVNQVLPMKNGEVVRTGLTGDAEEIPLKGIKPKYVAREEEMIEKTSSPHQQLKSSAEKITSIDDIYHSGDAKKVRVTSIDDVCVSGVDETVKSAECSPVTQSKVTKITDVVPQVAKQTVNSAVTSKSSLPSPGVAATGGVLSAQKVNQTQNGVVSERLNNTVKSSGESGTKVNSDAKDPPKKVPPVSAPRKSLMNQSQTAGDPTYHQANTTTTQHRKTSPKSSPPEPRVTPSPTTSSNSPSPTERHTNGAAAQPETSPGTKVTPESRNSLKSTLVQQTLNAAVKSVLEKKLKDNNGKSDSQEDIIKAQSRPSPLDVDKSRVGGTSYTSTSTNHPPTSTNHHSTASTNHPPTSTNHHSTASTNHPPTSTNHHSTASTNHPLTSTNHHSTASTNHPPTSAHLPDTPNTPPTQTPSVASRTPTDQNTPEGCVNPHRQAAGAPKTSGSQGTSESPTTSSKIHKNQSNQNPSEASRSLPDQSVEEVVSRAPSQSQSEHPKTQSDSPRTTVSHNHVTASRTSSNQSVPETPRTPCSESGNGKTPASRQGSTSSLMTTFGTPVVFTSTTPQSSFLHSSPRNMYDDTYSSPSTMHTPETTDFLKEIKSQPEVPAPTAGIQKSALYASTSCLKGLPGAKPVITPKPPKLKDKPKVPFKPSGSSPRIYATPSPVTPKVSIGSLSGAISTPNLVTLSTDDRSDTVSTASGTSEASSSQSHPDGRPEVLYRVTPEHKKPPPTIQAPAIPSPSGRQQVEAVYDIPVTLASRVSSTPDTTQEELKKDDDATIYHEIDDSISVPEVSQGSPTTSSGSPSESIYSPSSAPRQESTRCQSRSTFEANRSLLSAALDFGTKATRSSASKRLAPRPPAEEGEEDCKTEEPPEGATPVVTQSSLPSETSPPQDSLEGVDQDTTVAAPTPADNKDGESYSSFTDDFDDDDEEEEAQPTLRKAERSSSAIPFYRNSIGPIVTHDTKGIYDSPTSLGIVTTSPRGSEVYQVPSLVPSGCPGGAYTKPQASRSHSVPRASDHIVNIDHTLSGAGIPASSSSSSKFSFGRSGFFRPSSPPTVKRDSSSSDRGRDRSNKKTSSSRFSLKKLLRLGSGKDEEKKSHKEQEKRLHRENKKGRLTIIHPLDYNQNGVEVIARPEKTSPIYDYTGIYGYIPPPQLSAKLEDAYASITQASAVQASPAPSLASKRSESSAEASHGSSWGHPHPTTSSSIGGAAGTTIPATAGVVSSLPPATTITTTSLTTINTASFTTTPSNVTSVTTSTCVPIYATSPMATVMTTASPPPTTTALEKRSSFLRREAAIERRESGSSYTSANITTTTSHNLGFNSEGRPKPPPPPRKVSLETGQTYDIYSSLADLHTPSRPHHHNSPTPTTDTPSRPQRPPPPTRTPSNAGTKSGPPRPEPPRLGRDSVYANLGDVRAPITPRKPGRTASIRGEDDREKRRAPQPPQSFQQAVHEAAQQAAAQRLIKHQKQDSTSSSCSSITSSRAAKGPAPARPHQPHYTNSDYETVGRDDATNVTQISVGSSTCTVLSSSSYTEEVYQTPRGVYQTEDTTSAPSSRQEKTGRLSVRRASAMTHRSLEDQYGAVISANLEALSNLLDQLSTNCCPVGYEEVSSGVYRWEDITIDDDIIVGAGHRLFYVGVARGRDVVLMLTPETKVDAHHLLTPIPLATFKDNLPSHLLSHKYITRGKSTPGIVWVLPSISLTTMRTLAEEECLRLSAVPAEWERNTCLLLLQLVTGLKQLQAQGVEETCIDLTLVVRGSRAKGQDCDPRLILVPPTETGTALMSLCQCAAAVTLLLMGVDDPLECAREGNFTIPDPVPSQHAFNILLQILGQERAGSLTQVKCVLEVLLFGPDSSGCDAKEGEEVEEVLQRWLDLERATVLHSLIRGPLESSVLTKFHLLFLVRTNSRVLRETLKLLGDPEVTTF